MWRILRARRLSDTARATLGVAVTASQPEIKQAYRALAKEWHPDLHPGASKARAEEKFKAIKQAYEALAAAGVGGAAAGGAAQRQAQRQSRHRFRARRPQQSAAFTFTSYLGFRGRHGHSHCYEDTAHAAERVDAQRARRPRVLLVAQNLLPAVQPVNLVVVAVVDGLARVRGARGGAAARARAQRARARARPPARARARARVRARARARAPCARGRLCAWARARCAGHLRSGRGGPGQPFRALAIHGTVS